MNKNTKSAYRKLKALRAEWGYSQEITAKKLGMARSSYILKENGHRSFTLDEAERIAKLFSRDISDVFC